MVGKSVYDLSNFDAMSAGMIIHCDTMLVCAADP